MLELTVGENIFLGRLPTGFMGRIKMREVHSKAQAIIDEFGLDMKSTDKVKDLSVAYQQMVEIMKAYSRENLKMIAFDEPTASLSDSEIDALFRIIRKLKAEGKVIIYVSHRMAEIRQIADRVAIFKDGRFVGDSPHGRHHRRGTGEEDGRPGSGRRVLQSRPEQDHRRCGAGSQESLLSLPEGCFLPGACR